MYDWSLDVYIGQLMIDWSLLLQFALSIALSVHIYILFFHFPFCMFDRDDGKLTQKNSKILKSKFGDHYSWSKTPIEKLDRCFIQLAVIYIYFYFTFWK